MSDVLLIATHNQGKVAELEALLVNTDVEVLDLKQLEIHSVSDESGTTFIANAIQKARYYAELSDMLTIADDSGLEVEALGGRPGVNTARYGGPGLTSIQRYQLLLEELRNVPWEKRTAKFCCVAALAKPNGLIKTAVGECRGVISFEPSGDAGFGYDPVFFLPDYGMTMAELEPHDKQKISHRGRAVRKILPALEEILSAR